MLAKLAPTAKDAAALEYSWAFNGRPKQQEPTGDWLTWLILAGRGFGKTRTGVEWLLSRIHAGAKSVYIVGRTTADVRDVMMHGESGLIPHAPPWDKPTYTPSTRKVTWPSGAVALCVSAEEPDQLRGPAADTVWADEIAAWRYPEAWDQVKFGLRSRLSGLVPRACITTTPRPTDLIKAFLKDDVRRGGTVHITRGSTYENQSNLAPSFFDEITRKYEGTRLGRQELLAEILDDAPGALWKRAAIDAQRVKKRPPLRRVVVAVDPAITTHGRITENQDPVSRERRRSNETGIVAGGVGGDGHGYVLDDASGIYTPAEWAEKTVELFDKYEADHVTCEVNQGGDMVESNLRTARRNLPIRQVRASRGKYTRAEPVAALYEQGRVHHVGSFPTLEDQLCSWEPDNSPTSPDRLDALVWLLTDLMVDDDPDHDPGENVPAINTYNSPLSGW